MDNILYLRLVLNDFLGIKIKNKRIHCSRQIFLQTSVTECRPDDIFLTITVHSQPSSLQTVLSVIKDVFSVNDESPLLPHFHIDHVLLWSVDDFASV